MELEELDLLKMGAKLFSEIEKERKDKDYYNHFKKWSFEDYQEYRTNRQKNRKAVFIIVCVICIILYLSIVINVVSVKLNYELLTKMNNRDNILINESENRCEEINQTFMQSTITSRGVLLVQCSKENLVIGEERD